ncbi:MAG TPA: CpsD/CapB family tyrosine-protein kinase, partial [Polyangia bacterium]
TEVRAAPGADANWSGLRVASVERIRIKTGVKMDARAVLMRIPLSVRAASFRVLRHRLVDQGNPKVVVVTSAGDEEGKTTCALNLALVLAESGRNRVLLLEANTDCPALADLLGFGPPACFLDQLAQHRSEPSSPWTIAQLPFHELDVLAVQPKLERRSPMHGPTLMAAIASLRAAYDYLVIDTSSILSGLDVPLLADATDGMVLAARARQTRGRTLKAALDQVGASRVLGVALIHP